MGSPLVLRGLVENSMKRTAARLGDLLGMDRGERTPSLAIDPTLFQRFGVDKVPTFVCRLKPSPPARRPGVRFPNL